jgi:ABC-type polysaccharide/polyol phosphate export permease
VLIAGHGPDWRLMSVFAAISVATFMVGAAFFRRFKGILVDYE